VLIVVVLLSIGVGWVVSVDAQEAPSNAEVELAKMKDDAASGDVEAQLTLGFLYSQGAGVAKNAHEGAVWYRKAADQGHPEAQVRLGVLYQGGIGVAKSNVEAVAWYRKAAEQGHTNAQVLLAVMYGTGQGVPKDLQSAYFWLLLAAASDSSAIERIELRDLTEQQLTPEERAAAQAQARDWRPRTSPAQ
jgi:TPR repeat protein